MRHFRCLPCHHRRPTDETHLSPLLPEARTLTRGRSLASRGTELSVSNLWWAARLARSGDGADASRVRCANSSVPDEGADASAACGEGPTPDDCCRRTKPCCCRSGCISRHEPEPAYPRGVGPDAARWFGDLHGAQAWRRCTQYTAANPPGSHSKPVLHRPHRLRCDD